jgi:hypothetical protein
MRCAPFDLQNPVIWMRPMAMIIRPSEDDVNGIIKIPERDYMHPFSSTLIGKKERVQDDVTPFLVVRAPHFLESNVVHPLSPHGFEQRGLIRRGPPV